MLQLLDSDTELLIIDSIIDSKNSSVIIMMPRSIYQSKFGTNGNLHSFIREVAIKFGLDGNSNNQVYNDYIPLTFTKNFFFREKIKEYIENTKVIDLNKKQLLLNGVI